MARCLSEIAAAHKARGGVRVLLVDRLSKDEVGGEAVAKMRVCLIGYRSNPGEISRMLAHEFGHLLGLEHVNYPTGPNHEREQAASTQNLMSAASLNPAALLTPAQVKQARSSALARRFGGG